MVGARSIENPWASHGIVFATARTHHSPALFGFGGKREEGRRLAAGLPGRGKEVKPRGFQEEDQVARFSGRGQAAWRV